MRSGEGLTDSRNFDSFGNACLLLTQVLTGDAWSLLMDDCMITPQRGCSSEEGNCGSPWFAMIYFVSFQMIGGFVMLNLIVAVILENFTTLANQRPDLVSSRDIDGFKEIWGDFDQNADGLVPMEQLESLLNKVACRAVRQ